MLIYLLYLLQFNIVYIAAVARQVYMKPGCGVGGLKVKFGGNQRRGANTSHHHDASGAILRNILITLDELKITEPCAKGGRRITRIGQQALDLIAGQVARND